LTERLFFPITADESIPTALPHPADADVFTAHPSLSNGIIMLPAVPVPDMKRSVIDKTDSSLY
jgi:hypothetical protein